MKRNTTYRIFTVIFMAVILLTMMSITVYAEAPQERKPEVSTFDELSGKTISMLTGAPFEELISSKVPDVKEFTYYSTSSDMALALTSGKTDAFLQNTAVGELFVNRNPSLALFPEPLKKAEFGIAFSKGSKERSKWQAAYDKVCAGVIDELWEKWTGLDDSVKNLPVQDWEGKNGTIRVAACDSLEPMSYLNGDGELKGMEIELILMMAKELDYKVRFTSMEFSGILAAVESGKADMCCGSLIITEQRREVVDFIPHHDTAFILLVRSAEAEETADFWGSLSESFNRTFVVENRWTLILTGLCNTLIIAVASGIAGLVLGFILTSLKRKNNKLISALISVYNTIVAGLPAVVILMLLFYVVFAKSDISPVIVSIIGLTLIFAPKAYSIIINAVDSIDKGQLEAALALGYTEKKAYRRVILPQAKRIYFPLLRNQFVLLLKETSVVGFISAMDLTHAGDVIRGRTLEAFFPLITIAIVYFILVWLFTFLINQGNRMLESGRRSVQK